MAIINNPQNNKIEKKQPKGIIQTTPPPISPSKKKKKTMTVFAIGMTAIVLIGISTAVILMLMKSSPNITLPTIKRSPLDPGIVSLELERMTKIGGLIDLLEKKIVRTEESLKRAAKLKDDVLINTMRLVLAKNLENLNQHQEAFVEGMMQVHQWYTKNPDLVTRLLKQQVKKSQDVYKTGNIKTIDKIITLIKSVPEEKESLEYFKEKIMRQKV